MTVYSNFPEERELLAACQGHWMHLHPLPRLDPADGLEAILRALYTWYGETARMAENVRRDRLSVPALDGLLATTVQTPEILIDGPFGAHLLLETGDFSVVEHPIAPRTLAGPSHVHQNEDEYSYVLEGEVGFEVGDETFSAGAGLAELQARHGLEMHFSSIERLSREHGLGRP